MSIAIFLEVIRDHVHGIWSGWISNIVNSYVQLDMNLFQEQSLFKMLFYFTVRQAIVKLKMFTNLLQKVCNILFFYKHALWTFAVMQGTSRRSTNIYFSIITVRLTLRVTWKTSTDVGRTMNVFSTPPSGRFWRISWKLNSENLQQFLKLFLQFPRGEELTNLRFFKNEPKQPIK